MLEKLSYRSIRLKICYLTFDGTGLELLFSFFASVSIFLGFAAAPRKHIQPLFLAGSFT
jgi:hypothetical protein